MNRRIVGQVFAICAVLVLAGLLAGCGGGGGGGTSVPSEKIAFASNRDGIEEIYVMNSDGSAQTRLTNNAARDFDPSFGLVGP